MACNLKKNHSKPTITINLSNHGMHLVLGGVMPQPPHHLGQLLGGDGTIPILVKQGECLLELRDLLFSQLVSL